MLGRMLCEADETVLAEGLARSGSEEARTDDAVIGVEG